MSLDRIRNSIEKQYKYWPTGCGNSFGEILCHEIHTQGLTFEWLAKKWGINITILGLLILDHCQKLEADPKVNHEYSSENESKMKSDKKAIAPETELLDESYTSKQTTIVVKICPHCKKELPLNSLRFHINTTCQGIKK